MNYTPINFDAIAELSNQKYYKYLQDLITNNEQLLFPGRFLQRAAYLFPENIALVYKKKQFTYKQLYHSAVEISQNLKNTGVKSGDRVLLYLENSPAFYSAYYAVWQLGAVVVPLNTFLGSHELEHIVADAQPTCIIIRQENKDTFAQFDIKKLVVLEMLEDISLEDDLKAFEITDIPNDELAALLYTSGTTGLPKGVMLSSGNIMTNVLQGLTCFRINPEQRVLGALPLFHVFAQNTCVWTSIFIGATVILLSKIGRREIRDGFKLKPTIFLGIPALYGLLCMLKDISTESIEYFVCGGDALPDKIRSAFALLYRRKICCGYGLTETSPVIAFNMDDYGMRANTVGKPCIDVDISIRDDQGVQVIRGSIGVLWIKGANVMMGYYKAPKLTDECIQDGWFNTGDLAYIDDVGKIVIAGRIKDLIIHKGFNIYPQEIENIIMLHPAVIRVGVIGKADENVGEIPYAFVQLKQGEKDIEKKLRKLCEQHLALYKIPGTFVCTVEELPVTATGKVDKKLLRIKIDEQI